MNDVAAGPSMQASVRGPDLAEAQATLIQQEEMVKQPVLNFYPNEIRIRKRARIGALKYHSFSKPNHTRCHAE